MNSLETIRDEMPDRATESEYVRWLIVAVYAILCHLIESKASGSDSNGAPTK